MELDGSDILSMRTESDEAAYQAGYSRTMREVEWVRMRGWIPTERQLVQALMQAMRVYTAARSGKPIGGQRPAWLHGRADALRELLRQGVGLGPDEE
jgi:hypothetical protein